MRAGSTPRGGSHRGAPRLKDAVRTQENIGVLARLLTLSFAQADSGDYGGALSDFGGRGRVVPRSSVYRC